MTNKLLIDAVNRSDHAAVELAFKNGTDPDMEDEEGRPLLKLAVRAAISYAPALSKIEIVEMVLKAGPNLEAADETGMTVLSYAVQACSLSVGLILIKAGASIESLDCDGISVLGHAFRLPKFRSRRTEGVCMLLDAGADADKFLMSTGRSVLEKAIASTDADLVKQLLARGHNPRQVNSKTGKSPAQVAKELLHVSELENNDAIGNVPLRQICLDMKVYTDCLEARDAIESVAPKTRLPIRTLP